MESAAATGHRQCDADCSGSRSEEFLGMLHQVLFFVFAAVCVAGAINLLAQRHPINSALSLIVVMVSLSVLYLLLGAEFIAAVQIIVYAGAIMVLFVFVIMLLNAGVEERTNWSKMAKYAGVPLALILLLEIAHWLFRAPVGAAIANGAGAPGPAASTAQLSLDLFQQYLFPFEATSI